MACDALLSHLASTEELFRLYEQAGDLILALRPFITSTPTTSPKRSCGRLSYCPRYGLIEAVRESVSRLIKRGIVEPERKAVLRFARGTASPFSRRVSRSARSVKSGT